MKDVRQKSLPADRLLIELTSGQLHAVRHLGAHGYGDGTPASVVEYALARFVDDLLRSGLISSLAVHDED